MEHHLVVEIIYLNTGCFARTLRHHRSFVKSLTSEDRNTVVEIYIVLDLVDP